MASAAVATSLPAPYEDRIAAAVRAVDFAACARELAQRDVVFIPRFLPEPIVDAMVAEVSRFAPSEIHRVYLPWVRKAGAVGQMAIARKAPLLHALHRSPSLLDFTSRLAGRALAFKSEHDAHAAALYFYRRPGDHVGWHYDDCGCEAQASYTGTFGVINRTASRVEFELFRDQPGRTVERRSVAMEPGSFVFFCGSRAYHRVTPLGRGEDRVTYSFAYVCDGKRLTGFRRFTENVMDAVLYFGPRALFQKNYR